MSAFSGVTLYFNKKDMSLPEAARQFHYSQANVLILECKEDELKTQFPQVYENLKSCNHHRDGRTPFVYGQDLVASWLFEDDFLAAINKSSVFHVSLDGADRNREILPNVRTSAASDYKIILPSGKERKLELMCDYTGFWAKTGRLHLRDAKYENMVSSKSLFVAVSVTTTETKFTLYDFSQEIPSTFIRSHRPYGGKPAREISIRASDMKPYTPETLISEIESVLGA